jgi:hypothetical protein
MPKLALLLAFSALLLPVSSLPLRAWGTLGHRMAATASLKDLPPEVTAWFRGQEATVGDHASDPDHWKFRDPLGNPRHFLDSEPYGGADQVPLAEDAARAQLGPDLFLKNGQVPWTILDRVQRLSQAFSAGDRALVALEASWLCHYVADLSVPLHTTSNYNGDDTGQHGVHKHWETGLLERISAQEGWVPEVRLAALGQDPQRAPHAWLVDSFALVPGVLADDLTARQGGTKGVLPEFDHAYWQAFLRLQGGHVKEQLTLAAQRTAQMILFAWTQAGSPAAP